MAVKPDNFWIKYCDLFLFLLNTYIVDLIKAVRTRPTIYVLDKIEKNNAFTSKPHFFVYKRGSEGDLNYISMLA